MIFTKEGNCTIRHKKKDKSVKKITNAIKVAERKNEKIFQIKPKDYQIILTYSKKEYEKKTGLKNIKHYGGGYVKRNKIIIFSPEIKKLPFEINSFFIHEINHIFYTTLVGNYHPTWLSEGMATYFTEDYIKKVDILGWKKYLQSIKNPEKYLYYRYIKKSYFQNADKFYPLALITYSYLNKKYGERTIIKLLREFSKKPTKPNFEKLMKKYFKLTKKELVQEALNQTLI